jgi:hypothetical protein
MRLFTTHSLMLTPSCYSRPDPMGREQIAEHRGGEIEAEVGADSVRESRDW